MTTEQPVPCQTRVWGFGHRFRGCARRAVVDGFCRQHHPSAVEARWEASNQRHKAYMRERTAPYARIGTLEAENATLRARIAELEAADRATRTSKREETR